MCHSCRKLEDMYQGTLHGTDYYQHRLILQKMQSHDFEWLLPSLQSAWAPPPISIKTEENELVRNFRSLQKLQLKAFKSKEMLIGCLEKTLNSFSKKLQRWNGMRFHNFSYAAYEILQQSKEFSRHELLMTTSLKEMKRYLCSMLQKQTCFNTFTHS